MQPITAPRSTESSYVNPGEKVQIIGLMPLLDYVNKEIVPLLGPFASIIDKEAVIAGEVLLLLGAEHPTEKNSHNRPTLRQLLCEACATDIAQFHLTKFHNFAYEILKTINTTDRGVAEVRFMTGFMLVVRLH